MKKTVLRQYAKLIVQCGVNVQKGQEVMIYADLDQPEFVQLAGEPLLAAVFASVLPDPATYQTPPFCVFYILHYFFLFHNPLLLAFIQQN